MMHTLTGTISGIYFDFNTGKMIINLSVNEKDGALHCHDSLKEEEKLSIRIDKYRKKRSLNANAYAWKLLTEIGNMLRSDKEEIYIRMLKRYGQREVISVRADIPLQGFIDYFDEAGESELNGKTFKHYFVYKGSSEFDSREMSIFIDGIVDEAKALGIQTETPDEIAKMKSLWREAE